MILTLPPSQDLSFLFAPKNREKELAKEKAAVRKEMEKELNAEKREVREEMKKSISDKLSVYCGPSIKK